MKRYSGDLLAILGKKQKEAALRNNAYEVQMIDAHDIIPNSENFYGIREVEELATRMKISGHITPLEVVARDDEPGKYTLISGERRRAAMLYRLEQGEIEKALEKVHKQKTTLYGSGRTDSGVHAVGQAANFYSPFDSILL